MARLQSIENRLSELGGNEFQELCDIYLQRINVNYIAFSRTGSQVGKKQTTKGTPDSFFLLPNGNFIFVEHTVNESDKDKLENDVKSCLDTEKSKIPTKKIQEIILCTTRKVKTEQVDALKELLKDTYIQLTIYSLQEIAIDLMLNHNDLVYRYLDLPLDTGQIVSIEKFIDEYDRASQNIATPLNNEFFHREKELKEIEKSFESDDFTVLTGSAGIGKTKLAIETIKHFLSNNLNYESYCISYKGNARLIDDLPQYFDSDKNYIIFVDDANRIDAFDQILGFYKFSRKGSLKVLITVRDYALHEISNRCFDFAPNIVQIEKFTDEQLIDILKSDSIVIKNPDYHREIVRIADGNPRIAIMTAKLAIEKQNIYALSDVTDLFDKYFTTFIKDSDELIKGISLKCLGLIAFFHTMPYKDFDTVNPILTKFGILYDEYIETIDKLDKLELVEIQFEYVKIPEQNLATYFYYKTFIKDNILSFKTLLFSYYKNNSHRFKDTIIPANNTFNPEKVMDSVIPVLREYLSGNNDDSEEILKIFNDFWFYLQDETLEYIFNWTDKIPEQANAIYDTTYEMNQFSYKQDEILGLLRNFYRIPKKLTDSLELSFEYIRKSPSNLPELIYNIREYLTFTREDQYTGFTRQKTFIDWLLQKTEKEENIYIKAFYAIANDFLKFQYQYTRSERKNTFTIYTFTIPLNESIKEIRSKIWKVIASRFKKYSNESVKFLNDYSKIHPDVDEAVMKFDMNFVLDIINKELSNDSFEHCYYVQHQIWWWRRHKIESNEFNNLKSTFINPLYEFYLKISWDRLRDKYEYEFENWQEYEKLKEIEVRSSFLIDTLDDFELIYNNYVFLQKWKKENLYNIEKSMRLIIDENLTKNTDLGINILKLIINNGNEINYLPYGIFSKILNTVKYADIVYDLISSSEFKNKSLWMIMYFEYLDNALINKSQYDNLIRFFNTINDSIYLHFQLLSRYELVDSKLFSNLLDIIVNKIDSGIHITLEHDFYQKYILKLTDFMPLVKKSYIQQDELSNHFDYDGKCFLEILKIDSSFLSEYIEHITKDKAKIRPKEFRNLSIIWELENISEIVIDAINTIVKNVPYFGFGGHFVNALFSNSKKESKEAEDFIEYYIEKESADYRKMNVIFDVIRHSKNHLFEKSILQYLTLNQDIETFKKISWNGTGGTYSGDVNIGDIWASQWRNLLAIVEKSNVGIKLIPIKKYINDRIDSELRHAESERKRKFMSKDY